MRGRRRFEPFPPRGEGGPKGRLRGPRRNRRTDCQTEPRRRAAVSEARAARGSSALLLPTLLAMISVTSSRKQAATLSAKMPSKCSATRPTPIAGSASWPMVRAARPAGPRRPGSPAASRPKPPSSSHPAVVGAIDVDILLEAGRHGRLRRPRCGLHDPHRLLHQRGRAPRSVERRQRRAGRLGGRHLSTGHGRSAQEPSGGLGSGAVRPVHGEPGRTLVGSGDVRWRLEIRGMGADHQGGRHASGRILDRGTPGRGPTSSHRAIPG